MHPVFNVTLQNNFGNFNIQVGVLWEKNTLILSFPPIFQSKHCIIFLQLCYIQMNGTPFFILSLQ